MVQQGSVDCFVAIAPLHKRFAFVAGDDGFASFFRQFDQIWSVTDPNFRYG